MKSSILRSLALLLVTSAALTAQTVSLSHDTPMEVGKGSVVLRAGTSVDVMVIEGNMATVSAGNLKGKIPVAALGLNPQTAPAAPAAPTSPTTPTTPLPSTAPMLPKPAPSPTASASFRSEVSAAAKQIEAEVPRAQALVIAGEIDRANDLLLARFPEATRTLAQTFMLGNLMFGLDPARAYALHQQVAKTLPDDPNVLYEWALDQHRAKEYSGALATYRRYSQLVPRNALAYGLAAECAIRLGDSHVAARLWQQSEQAPQGTREKLETLICELNGRIQPNLQRQQLLKRTRARDAAAAVELLLLDSDWRSDWWNTETNTAYLENDSRLVRTLFPAPSGELHETLALVGCLLLPEGSGPAEKIKALTQAGYLYNDAHTLPKNGKVLSRMITLAGSQDQQAALRSKFGAAVLAQARQNKDTETYNAAAFLYFGTPELATIDQEGWDAAHDARFALSRLMGIKDLKLDSPLVQRAQREFPNDSELAHLIVRLAAHEGKPLETYLVNAVKAEYTKLSSERPGADAPRPSVYVLGQYFAALAKIYGLSPTKP